jgi:hypothetical protein
MVILLSYLARDSQPEGAKLSRTRLQLFERRYYCVCGADRSI